MAPDTLSIQLGLSRLIVAYVYVYKMPHACTYVMNLYTKLECVRKFFLLKMSVKISQKSLCNQGCQMVYFYTKNPNLCIVWRSLEWKMLVYLGTFGI
jgi:hypothetical protein